MQDDLRNDGDEFMNKELSNHFYADSEKNSFNTFPSIQSPSSIVSSGPAKVARKKFNFCGETVSNPAPS